MLLMFLQAPSPVQKCNCQCHHYTYVDAVGVTQGNCNAADATGGRWCYLKHKKDSECDDIQGRKDNIEEMQTDKSVHQ